MERQAVKIERILGGLWGALAGDALGVPVEFSRREERNKDPVTGMRGFGTHGQPPGTWSDDGSLILCTAESLLHGFDTSDMGSRFVRFSKEGYWTPYGRVFDIGGTTRRALKRIAPGARPELAGEDDENSNGNGSLMRILPVALLFSGRPVPELLDYAHRASSLTHRHTRSKMACGFYCLIACALLEGATPADAYLYAVEQALRVYQVPPYGAELPRFQRLLDGKIARIPRDNVRSTGYVIDTLEAGVWCLLNAASFSEAVLMTVNLGDDTDTTGCVTGGLAGLHFGLSAIPEDWLQSLARKDDIGRLFAQFAKCTEEAVH
jgi:ADP-ribosyl-[dinitrogen reductase] hydrolase